jgi:hypothetical protein
MRGVQISSFRQGDQTFLSVPATVAGRIIQ